MSLEISGLKLYSVDEVAGMLKSTNLIILLNKNTELEKKNRIIYPVWN